MPVIFKSEKTGKIYSGISLNEAIAKCNAEEAVVEEMKDAKSGKGPLLKEEPKKVVINEKYSHPEEDNIKKFDRKSRRK